MPTLNALENVELSALLRGEKNSASREQAKALLGQPGLGKRLENLPAQLSGGEQQRMALARAFNGRPGVLFADEPTGNLIVKRAIVSLIYSSRSTVITPPC